MNADNGSFILKMNLLYEISGSDIGANDFRVLECETKYIGVQMSAFRRNVLSPSSWLSKNVGGKNQSFVLPRRWRQFCCPKRYSLWRHIPESENWTISR